MRIKEIPEFSGATVMMLSSSDQHNDASRCRELGIKLYLIKPVKQSELLGAILKVVGKQERGQPLSIASSQKPLQKSIKALSILLAEDNEVNQKIIVRMLANKGHKVTVAADGKEALASLDKEPFDLVLMDVQMPNMNGFEATAAIREKERLTGIHLPIVALTAHAMKGDQERCLRAGMDRYLPKPVRSNELFQTIEELIPSDFTMQSSPNGETSERPDHSAFLL